MTDRLILRPEQEAAVQRALNEPTWSVLNASEMSAGKTVMHVEQGLRMGANVVVVVGPLGTVDGWAKTLHRQSGGKCELRHVTSSKVAHTTPKMGRANLQALMDGEPGWYFIGREYFRARRKEADGNMIDSIDASKIHADLGIVDEVQVYGNRKGVGYKKLMQFQPVHKVACSGTWFGNKVENMWGVTRWLWPQRTDRSFWRWVDTWLTTEYDHFAGKKVTGEKKPGAYAESLPCYIRIEPTLVELETPEERWVDLSPQQRKMYDKMERDMFVEVESDVLMTEVPIAMRTRLRQITMAVCDAETYTEFDFDKGVEVVKQRVWFPEDAKSTKFDELKALIEERPDEPMLILTDSAQWVKLAASRLPESFAWMGGVSQDERNEAKQAFIDGRLKYIVAQIASISEGVDMLQFATRTVVWASQSDSPMLNAQALKRVHRTGQDKPVRQVFIKARDTIDDEQHLALLNKQLQIKAALASGEQLV